MSCTGKSRDFMGIGNFQPPAAAPPASNLLDTPAQTSSTATEDPVIPSGPRTPNKDLVGAVEARLQDDIDEGQGSVKKALTYEDRLKEMNISMEEAHGIRDALLIDGFYSEGYALSPRVTVRFRSRSYQDYIRYHQEVERRRPQYTSERDEIMVRYFLAASLEALGGNSFTFPVEAAAADAAFTARMERILSMPAALVELLNRKLYEFDEKLRVVLSEGAVEDF